MAGPAWGELWWRRLRVQSAPVMESHVAAAGARGTEAVAGQGPVLGSAGQGAVVSASKGAVRWRLLRQVRATTLHVCLWPLPSQVPGVWPGSCFSSAAWRWTPSPLASPKLSHGVGEKRRLARLEGGAAKADPGKLRPKWKNLLLACLMGGTAALHRVLLLSCHLPCFA